MPPCVHRWNDRLAGALAVVLWSLIPQWFVVVGNANLTGAFAQSIATASLLTAAILALGARDFLRVAALFVLVSVAFLSHVGTFPLLFAALRRSWRSRAGGVGNAPSACRLDGSPARPSRRPSSRW